MSIDFNVAMPWAGIRRVILNQDGTRAGYLHPTNSNKWEDGTDVNWTTVESSVQNVMVEIPKFYYCKKSLTSPKKEYLFGVTDKPVETDRISVSDWEIHPAFYRDRLKPCDDNSGVAVEVDYRYAPAFKGWVDGVGRLRSLPNKQPTVNQTIGTFRTYAKNMGNGWSQFDYNLLYAIQMLYITEYGHPDSQTMVGRGYVDGNSGATTTGGTLQYGNNTFGETTGKKQMSYRGIEDFWGNTYCWIDGLYSDNSRNILVGNKGFNNAGSGYANVGRGATSDMSGNIREIQGFKEAGFILKVSGGNNNSAGLYDTGLLRAGGLPVAGGPWFAGSNAGAFRLPLADSASAAFASFAAALSC